MATTKGETAMPLNGESVSPSPMKCECKIKKLCCCLTFLLTLNVLLSHGICKIMHIFYEDDIVLMPGGQQSFCNDFCVDLCMNDVDILKCDVVSCLSNCSLHFDNDQITDAQPVKPEDFHISAIPDLDFTLNNLLSASIGLSAMAADKIIAVKEKHKEDILNKGYTQKDEGVDEPVTEADKESNNVIINGFRTLFANSRAIGNENEHNKIELNIISEEINPKIEKIIPLLEYIDPVAGGNKLLDPSKISIIIDPLDATKEFTEETDADGTDLLSHVTTLICIVHDETPIAGIFNRPFVENEPIIWGVATDQTHRFHGLRMKQPDISAQNIVTVSRSHSGHQGDIVSDKLNKQPLLVGGAGYKTYLVLTGQVDAYIHVTAIKTWDVCAGHALLKSVGGDITDKSGKPLRYEKRKPKFRNGLIASLDKDKIQKYAEKLKGVTSDY